MVNQIRYSYDGWGNVAKSEQEHDRAVDGNTPAVVYNYADGADGNDAKYVRLDNVVYPDGRTVYYRYPDPGTDLVGAMLSRLDRITDASGDSVYVKYTYLGVGTIVKEEHPGVTGGLTLNYNLDGSYGGWDRFGRIVEQDWQVNGSDVDHIDYTYDRNSNRTARTNRLASAYSESYGYDGLDRLTDADRNGVDLQSWTLEGLGNWAETTIGTDDQTRAHNAANETGMISGDLDWVDPAYDAAGNMTRAPKPGAETTPLYCTYDGWNRLVQVRVGAYPLAKYEYDAAGRRIEKAVYLPNINTVDCTLHYFWNENYQNIETRKNDSINPIEQWVYDIRYVDAPVVRFYDSNVDGDYLDAGDNTLYVIQDANFNVTAIVDLGGSVVERYVYTPYGTRTVLDASFANPSSTSAYAQDRGHQGLVIDPETGLVYNRARYLHTSLGRFTVRDLMGYVDGMSLYCYARSSPVSLTDWSGLAVGGEGEVFSSMTAKRRQVKWLVLLKQKIGKKPGEEDIYGHWWMEFDGESYGWWPKNPVDLLGTLFGVSGELNGQTNFGGTPTTDPHHGDAGEEEFHPRRRLGLFGHNELEYGPDKGTKCRCATEDQVKDCFRAFALQYSGPWKYPLGQNCHSFQRKGMKSCCMKK